MSENGQVEITPEMIEAGSQYLFRSLGPADDADYDQVALGVIEAMAAQARIGHGKPVSSWLKK
jgi:hypothetical protein